MAEGRESSSSARVLGPHDGDILGALDGVRDRFMVDRQDSDGRFALVEHLMAPRALAAPVHRHSREDEYSYILEGRVGALLGDEEVFAEVGYLIFKPRAQWHTFWNAGDAPARILEIISPGGLDELFRELGAMDSESDPAAMAASAARYGAELDFGRTVPLLERHGLTI